MIRVEHGDCLEVIPRLVAETGRRAILIEREEEYVADIYRRLEPEIVGFEETL